MIVIPSYNRPNMKTLKMLEKHHISKEQITIYVVKEEEEDYKKAYPDYTIVVGIKGIVPQRQFIMDSYPEGMNLVFMDDDIEEIDLSMTSLTLKEFIDYAFQQCNEYGAYLWGVYPVYNPYFRKNQKEMTTCLNFIVGCFYGIIVRHQDDLKIKNMIRGNKDDVENTLNHFIKDRVVLRFNKVAPKTKYFAKGGIGLLKDRMESIKEEVIALQKAFPNYGRIKVRKNGVYEFVLKKITSK